MQIKHLYAKNFLSIDSIEFDFPTGLVLIDGWDEDRGRYIGTGKSALMNAVTYALFGNVPISEVKKADLINDESSYLETTIKFDSFEGEVVITRTRDHKTGTVNVYLNGDEILENKEERIVSLIGFTFTQFIRVFYIFQNSQERFLFLNDTEKKQFLTSLLELEPYDKAYKLAHQKLSSVQNDIASYTGSIKTLSSQIESAKAEIVSIRKAKDDFAKEKNIKMAKMAENAKELKAKITELTTLKESVSENTNISSLESLLSSLDREKANIDKKKKALSSIDNEIYLLERNKKDVFEKAKKYDRIPSDSCSECGQKLPNFDLASFIEKAKADKEGVLAKIPEIDAQIADKKAALAAQSSVIEEAEQVLQNKIRETTSLLAKERASVVDYDTPLQLANSRLEKVRMEATLFLKEEEKITDRESNALSRLSDLSSRLEKMQEDIVKKEQECTVYKTAKTIFSPTGVRAVVFDSVVTHLNEKVQEYLDVLSSGTIRFRFEPNESNGKIDYSCIYNGKPRTLGLMSGGEKQTLSLAIDLALIDVVCLRLHTHPNMLMIDEGLNGLDSIGKQGIMPLLEQLAQKRERVYVIDHANEFKESFTKTLTMVKSGDRSRLECRHE